MSKELEIALDNLISQYCENFENSNHSLSIEYDVDWPSPCYQEIAEQGQMVGWKPVLMDESVTFSNLEEALSLAIHPDLISYYCRFWSNNIDVKTDRGNLQLLFAWNQPDLVRLQQNLVGHVLMKRRLKQPETFFIGLTDEDDFIISLDNQSGQIMLEQIGLVPQEILASNMAEFIDGLTVIPEHQ